MEDLWLFGAGPYHIHLASNHIDELGYLVESISTSHPAQWCYTRVIWRGPYLPHRTAFRHRPEFVDLEDPSALVDRSTVIGITGGATSRVETDPRLSEEDRTT